jgi:hypothetical protein
MIVSYFPRIVYIKADGYPTCGPFLDSHTNDSLYSGYRFDDEEKNLSTDVDCKNVTSLYNVTITAQVSKNDIRDESKVTCLMKINDTDYERKETIIYDGMLLNN